MNREVSGKEKILHRLTLLFVAIQPLIDLDYLAYTWLDQYGLPRPSTIIRFLILPAQILACFFLREKKRRKVFLLALVYGLLLGVYFVLHCRQCSALVEKLDLTDNFYFSTWQELTYVLTLVLPYGMIYLFVREQVSRQELQKICECLSLIISVPILLGDLFVFGMSTYYGYTVANFFAWFTGIYDWYHPRTLASKFFFNEGNTIGILLFMILPLLYAFYLRSEDPRERRRLGTEIFVQSLSMQILATRVATYGAVLMPACMLVLWALDHLLHRKEHPSRLARGRIVFCLCAVGVFGGMLNWTPAVQNQKVDAVNDTALLHNGMAAAGMEELANAEDLIPGTAEYINFYVYMFETYGINARYIQSVPSMYYTEYYSYQHDPKFWVDVTFMPVFDRVSGRQIEQIFFSYKYQNLTGTEKILGMGYSTFMNGSIVLEKDFKQQIYTLGYAGFLLCVFPWIAVILYGLYWFLRKHRQLFTFENASLVVALMAGMGAAWLSGHVLDQFLTTSFAALLVALLLGRVREARHAA